MPAKSLHYALLPLRGFLWGSLICIVTFEAHGLGRSALPFPILLSEVVVILSIAALLWVEVNAVYRRAISYVLIMTVLGLAGFYLNRIYQLPHKYDIACLILLIYGFNIFSIALQKFCVKAQLEEAAIVWKITAWCFVICLTVPIFLAAVIAFGLYARNVVNQVHVNTGFEVITIFGGFIFSAFIIPFLFFYGSLFFTIHSIKHPIVEDGQNGNSNKEAITE